MFFRGCVKYQPLSFEQKLSFEKDGFLTIPNALSNIEVEELIDVCDLMMEEFNRESNHPYSQRRDGMVQKKCFQSLITHESTLSVVAQLLSGNIHLHTTSIIYKQPESEDDIGRRSWHRDIGMTQDLGHEGVVLAGIKVGYCLTDFLEPNSGVTLFAPGSHLLSTPLPIPIGRVDPINTTELILKKGDAFLFENRVFHTPAPNLSNSTAKVVIIGYSYRWMGGLKSNMDIVQPDSEIVNKTNPMCQQLLGGESNAIVEWFEKNNSDYKSFEWTMEV